MDVFSFDAGLTFWTLLTFGCLFAVLARFTFKPLRKIMEERESRVRASLEKAEKARQQAEDLLAKNEEKLTEARSETRRIINDGHRVVAEMKREARDSAKRDADLIVGQARTDIERELQRSLEELKGTVANLSLRIARQVIKENLDEKRHEALADDFVQRLKKSHAVRRS